MRAKIPQLKEALHGPFGPEHALVVARLVAPIDHAEEVFAELSAQTGEAIAPWEHLIDLLMTIPGGGPAHRRGAHSRGRPGHGVVPTSAHLASWAGMCPGNNELAGKHRSGRTRKGSKWLREALVEAAHAAPRSKGTYLSAQYARLRGRRGPTTATVAVAYSILVIAYHLISKTKPTPTSGPTTSSPASPRKPTKTALFGSSSGWATRSHSSQHRPPDHELTGVRFSRGRCLDAFACPSAA
jgi:transposase